MKNSNKSLQLFAIGGCLLSIALLPGCKKGFDDLNTDPNHPKDAPTSYLLSSAEKGLMDNTIDEFWGGAVGNLLGQYWAENQYTNESQYLFLPGPTDKYWGLFYAGGQNDEATEVGGLKELQEIIDRCSTNPLKYAAYGDPKNQMAIATILQVWEFQNITDTWGDVPFSESLKDLSNTQPKYDKQEDIYTGLITRLDSASSWLNEANAAPQGDLIYGGNLTAWRKFLNSLRLRVAIRIADRNPVLASAVINRAVAAGVFTSNDDNALFKYATDVPNVNPVFYARLLLGKLDYSSTSVMVQLLDSINDSRIGAFYDTAATPGLGFVGRPYGQNFANAASLAVSDVSQPSQNVVLAPTAPGVYMDYAQVQFILAEAVERGFISTNSAEQYYKDGIDASWIFWTGDAAPGNYHTQAGVSYTQQKTAGKTWRQIIGQQKWLALYNQGVQGWVEWRRLDFGILKDPVDGFLDGTAIPVRMRYPQEEQSVNGASYSGAITNQGADDLGTKVWWDMN